MSQHGGVDAAELLAEYAARHDEGADGGGFARLAELFAPGGELEFVGVPNGPFRGREAILAAFEDGPPPDRLRLDVIATRGFHEAAANYAWRTVPDGPAGTLRLRAGPEGIVRLSVRVGEPELPPPRDRFAVRAVVLSDDGRFLLARVLHPEALGSWWVAPGGGVDPGEDDDAALRRELLEEVGLEDPPPGPWVWTRTHVFEWRGAVHRQRERFRLVRVPVAFDPSPRLDPGLLEREGFGGARWWTADELASAGAGSFAPRRLPEFLGRLLRDGPPSEPIDVGI